MKAWRPGEIVWLADDEQVYFCVQCQAMMIDKRAPQAAGIMLCNRCRHDQQAWIDWLAAAGVCVG